MKATVLSTATLLHGHPTYKVLLSVTLEHVHIPKQNLLHLQLKKQQYFTEVQSTYKGCT